MTQINMPAVEVHKRLGVYNSLIKTGEASVGLYHYRDEKLRRHLKKLCKAQILRYKITRGVITYTVKNPDSLYNYLTKNPIVRDSHVEKLLHLLKPTQ